MPSQRDSVRFVIHNYSNGSHFYVKRPGDGDNFVEVGYQNGAGRTPDGHWVTQPIAIPYEETFAAVVASPYGNIQFWLSPYTITTNLDQYGNVHIDPRYGVVRPDGTPLGAPQGENNASARQPTQRAVYAPVAQEVNAPSRYPVTASVGKGKFKSAGDVIGDSRTFAVHNFPEGSRFFVLRPGDATWVNASGEDAGFRDGVWITSPILMPADSFDIRVQLADRTERTWRGVTVSQIDQLFPALTDPVQIDASASESSSPFWFNTTVSFDGLAANSRIYEAVASGSVWTKGTDVTLPGRWIGSAWNIDSHPTQSDLNGQKVYLVENMDDEKKFIVVADSANADVRHVISVNASTPSSASIQYPAIWAPTVFAPIANNGNDKIDVEPSAGKDGSAKSGSISIHSSFAMRKVSITNTAGGNVADAPASGQSATLTNIIPDTYAVTAVLADGRKQKISGVQVSAGAVSTVELTPESLVSSSASTPATHSIVIRGLEQGDRVSLSQPDSEVASAIAQANSDVHLDNIANGSYSLNVAFANGNMGNRQIVLNSDSASSVTYDFSGSRGDTPSTAKSYTGWIVGGLLVACGAVAWKYKDKIIS